ncbi:MAG: hypothetical protein M3Z46_05365 [Actinomycetota bacterium]|nr:hypothetical protein [Actinomycetota bacterium]
MKRVLALVAAVAMVGGAYFVRSRVIDSDSSSGDGVKPPAFFTVGCVPELMSVCEAAASKKLHVLSNPVDVDNAAASAPKMDAWLTYADGPGMVNAASSSSSGQVFNDGPLVAAGRLSVLTTADREAALRRSCAAVKLTWRCLVRSAGRNWSAVAPSSTQLGGTVKIGVGDPRSTLGAILVGPLALATARGSDPSIDDIDTKAVTRVVASVDQQASEDEVQALTVQGPAAYSAVVAPEGLAEQAAASTRGQGLGLTVIYPEPVAQTLVVLAPPSGKALDLFILDLFHTAQVRRALTAVGWTPANSGGTSGLPAPDVLFALRKELNP